MGLAEELDFDDQPTNPRFELVMQPRDSEGKPLGKKKSVKTNSGFKLWRFWMNNQGKPKKKKGAPKSHKKKQRYKEVLPRGKQADNLAKEVAKYAEKKQRERDEQAQAK